jgi:hypothetical protein
MFDGEPEEAIGLYHRLLHEEQVDEAAGESGQWRGEDVFEGGATLSLKILDSEGVPRSHFEPGQPWRIVMDATFEREITDPVIGIGFSQAGRGLLYASYTGPGDYRGEHGPDKPLHADVSMTNPFLSGSFLVQGVVRDSAAQSILGASAPAHVAVSSLRRDIGLVDLQATYRIDGATVTVTESPGLRWVSSPDDG